MNRNGRSVILGAVLLTQQLCLSLSATPFFGQDRPDLILVNGKIFTSDAATPYVQALAMKGERILANGDSAKIAALAGPKTKRIDLGGVNLETLDKLAPDHP